MFVYHFVDPNLRVEIVHKKEGEAKNGGLDFEIGDTNISEHLYWGLKEISCRPCMFFLLFFFFGNKKVAFKCSLGLYFQPLVIEFF